MTALLTSSLACSVAFGLSAKSKLQVGAGGYDETLSAEDDFVEGSHRRRTEDWFWSFDGEFAETPDTSLTGYESGPGFGAAVFYTYSYTPEESLIGAGPEFDFYYLFDLVPKSEPGPSAKTERKVSTNSTMRIKTGIKSTEYIQTFTGSTAPGNNGAPRPTTGFNNLRQISQISGVSISPSKFLTTGLTFTYYFYNRDVADFLNFIQSPSAARTSIGGFANSITNFAQSSLEWTASIYPSDDWSIDLEIIDSISAVDISQGWSFQGIVSRSIEEWTIGLGCENDQSPLNGNNYYGVLNIEYEF